MQYNDETSTLCDYAKLKDDPGHLNSKETLYTKCYLTDTVFSVWGWGACMWQVETNCKKGHLTIGKCL